jgi:hypothetical protein
MNLTKDEQEDLKAAGLSGNRAKKSDKTPLWLIVIMVLMGVGMVWVMFSKEPGPRSPSKTAMSVRTPTPKQAEPDVATDPQTNQRCEAKWGDNYRMQRYCRKKENSSHAQLMLMSDGIPGEIRRRCVSKWRDEHGSQWRMVLYCVNNQMTAKAGL